MNATSNKKKPSRCTKAGTNMKQLLPALAVVGGACGLVATPTAAVELGTLEVQSSIGQPLRASIAYALNPNEQLHDYCIFLKPGMLDNGLPVLNHAKITVTDKAIVLSGTAPLREPMLALQLSVDCPYTAHFARDYTLFIDPASPTKGEPVLATVDQAMTESPEPAATPPRAGVRTRSPAHSAAPRGPVEAGSRYRVQPGDSLSAIVARVKSRPPGLWPAVQAVFDANPGAFIDGDMNKLKAGSWLEIPDLYEALGGSGDERPATVMAAAVSAPEPATDAATAYDHDDTVGQAPAKTIDPAFNSGFETVPELASTPTTAAPVVDATANVTTPQSAPASDAIEPEPESQVTELHPGDVIMDSGPFVSPTEEPDQGPSVTAGESNIPVVRSTAPGIGDRSWSGLAWLGGSGVALILGLLLFGRRLREYFGSSPVGVVADPTRQRRHDDQPRKPAPVADVDFQFDDIRSPAASMSLDADLGLGTGLQDSADIDLAQDFGFSATGDLGSDVDLMLPEAAAAEEEQLPTDIIPPQREPSILDSEVPPSDDDDEYDLSMIVDATKQRMHDTHLTAKDLKAVQVDAEALESTGGYTLNQEIDYKILEQDYEEEFTATQALNDEIAKAALQLAERMEHDLSSDSKTATTGSYAEISSDLTADLPESARPEITAELTANLREHGDAMNDELISDLDDTGVNEELTAEMPPRDDDVTVDMDLEGGRIDTKKSKVS